MNKKRICIYSICIAVFIVLIMVKQAQIHFKRNKPIVSTLAEWQQHGKPVVVTKVFLKDVPVFTKITLQPTVSKAFEGYVPKTIQLRLAAGQGVYMEHGNNKMVGSISNVSEEISIDTGLFCVQVLFKEPVVAQEWIVAYVHTDTLHDVICVSNNIIEREDEKMYVWKVEGKQAFKQHITIGERNGYGAVVLKGLGEGDVVVCKGFTQLFENDLVDIIESIKDPGAQHD